MTENTPTPATKTRPLGVVHLIFGLVFCGIAAIWLIGEANDSDTSDLAAGFPVVLIGAGIIGLVAVLVNQRRAKAQLASAGGTEYGATEYGTTESPASDDQPVEETTILSTEKDES